MAEHESAEPDKSPHHTEPPAAKGRHTLECVYPIRTSNWTCEWHWQRQHIGPGECTCCIGLYSTCRNPERGGTP